MAVTLTGAGGLFTILKDIMTALESANTSQGTTIPNNVDAILAEMGDNDTIDGDALAANLVKAAESYKSNGSLHRALQALAEDLIIDRVNADAPQVPNTIADSLDELIRQMEASSDSVEENVVTATVSTNPGTDAPVLVVSKVGPDGLDLEKILAETIIGVYSSDTVLTLTSGPAEANSLLSTWPKASNIRASLTVQDTGLLANHSFDDQDDRATSPDDWWIDVGVIGTSITVTDTEVQTITVTGGPPTSGHFTITHTRSDGFKQTTAPLAYNASAADVQAALRKFTGFPDVTVTYAASVYTINFNAVFPAGNQTALTTWENFDAGSLVVAESTAGETAYRHRALNLLGDGAELTKFKQPLQTIPLEEQTVYALSLQLQVDAATTGTLIVELVDGAETVINDDQTTANSLTIDLSTISTSAFEAKTVFFRTPKVLPAVYYLQIRLSIAIANTKNVYLDECILAKATELYPGGPYAVLFEGDRDLQDGDRYVITTTNDQAGRIQTWFWRWFDRILPSATAASETIPET